MPIDPNWFGEHPMYTSAPQFILTIVSDLEEEWETPGITLDQVYYIVQQFSSSRPDYLRYTDDGTLIKNPTKADVKEVLDRGAREGRLVYVKEEDKYYDPAAPDNLQFPVIVDLRKMDPETGLPPGQTMEDVIRNYIIANQIDLDPDDPHGSFMDQLFDDYKDQHNN